MTINYSLDNLIDQMRKDGTLLSDAVERALRRNDRRKFVPPHLNGDAYFDAPLPIGDGQTISQPSTVVFMLERLEPQPGQTVLDIGAGSGWQTSLLSSLVGSTGRVIAIEIRPTLLAAAKKRVETRANIHWVLGSGYDGYPKHAPYDRIIVAAAGQEIPEALLQQLKVGGRLLMPVNHNLVQVDKRNSGEYEQQLWPGFSFVPFIDAADMGGVNNQ
ncbi:MAG: protein-L-isoaspartate O-methyltransferase [Candidatus Komeilibacteria bacterium]|nr:protein-L-isoaspartate O-methyltransferase [Candidatus Komeilibacteria bacterium]